MKNVAFEELQELFAGLEENEKAFVHCCKADIDRLMKSNSYAKVILVRDFDDRFILIRQKRSDRDEVLAACSRCGFGQVELETNMKITYVRNLVSDYNKENGTNIRVRDEKNGLVILTDDLLKRKTVSIQEFNNLCGSEVMEVEFDDNDDDII